MWLCGLFSRDNERTASELCSLAPPGAGHLAPAGWGPALGPFGGVAVGKFGVKLSLDPSPGARNSTEHRAPGGCTCQGGEKGPDASWSGLAGLSRAPPRPPSWLSQNSGKDDGGEEPWSSPLSAPLPPKRYCMERTGAVKNRRLIGKETFLNTWQLFKSSGVLPVLFRRRHRTREMLSFLCLPCFLGERWSRKSQGVGTCVPSTGKPGLGLC